MSATGISIVLVDDGGAFIRTVLVVPYTLAPHQWISTRENIEGTKPKDPTVPGFSFSVGDARAEGHPIRDVLDPSIVKYWTLTIVARSRDTYYQAREKALAFLGFETGEKITITF